MPRLALLVLLLVLPGCSLTRSYTRPPVDLAQDGALNAFLTGLRDSVERHDWQAVLGRAEAAHRRTQVEEMGMGEPQYIAELLGLHHVGNSIASGEAPTWNDLERIERVSFDGLAREGGRRIVLGHAVLGSGEWLDLRIEVVQAEGGYRLTGAAG